MPAFGLNLTVKAVAEGAYHWRVIDQPFVSYAQNGEDVVLRRAFRHIVDGRYIDVGANNPTHDSISRSFYDQGWRGITVEPLQQLAVQHRLERPRDVMVEAVITETDGGKVVLHSYDDSGLSTTMDGIRDQHAVSGRVATDLEVDSRRLDSVLEEAGWQGEDIHFMTIDTEGAEGAVLNSIDLHTWRPWVLVIEATLPNSTERSHESWEASVLAAGYEFCLFDGLSRFYVAKEHAVGLRESLDHPACIHDNYITLHTSADRARIVKLDAQGVKLNARIVKLDAQIQSQDAQIQSQDAQIQSQDAQIQSQDAQIGTLDVARNQAVIDAVRWRTASLTRWADSLSASFELAQLREQTDARAREASNELTQLREQADALAREAAINGQEVAAMRRTVSWRLTAPIRKVRALTRSHS
jgi:FkbM family methyltransferase